MKINLSELVQENKITKTSEQLAHEKATEEMLRYDHIIRPIAAKYGKTWCLTFDEVYSELTYKIFTLGSTMGWDKLNESMVAKICYNRAVDVYRSARKRWDRTAAEEAMLTSSVDEAQSNYGTQEEAESNVLFSEFLDRYPKTSREYKYLVIKMTSEGLIPSNRLSELHISIPMDKKNLTNCDISVILGLHPRSKSFETMRHRLMSEMRNWFLINSSEI